MGNASGIVFTGIAPHPPIMVPEVGGQSIAEVRSSIDAMAEFTRRIIANDVQTVVLISPHAPLDASAFVAYRSPTLHGDFGNFRAPDTDVEYPLDVELLQEIARAGIEKNFQLLPLDRYPLDHGTLVPLYFLNRNGWRGNVVALGYSFLTNDDHVRFGRCIKVAADTLSRPVAFVASGDLSHRLKPEAPAGFNPSAHFFDEEVVEALNDNTPERIASIDPKLRSLAGECGFRSMLVAIGVTDGLPRACDVLSYEAPFGVGYLVAQITNSAERDSESAETSTDAEAVTGEIPKLARLAVENLVTSGSIIEAPRNATGLLAERAACFVSIKTRDGDLRGCIGTIEPAKNSLAEEIVMNALNAATRDPRFVPVEPHELGNLRYSVDVLSPPEPATFETLDPAIYGVIVEDQAGTARGLLLPALPGVDTTAKQVEITARKAGIPPGTPLKLQRFRVQRFYEQENDPRIHTKTH